MQTGPKIKLSIDLHKMEKYFPLDYSFRGDFGHDIKIDRLRYDEVEALLDEFDISEARIIQELCFILLWIENEIRAGDGQDSYSGKYYQMRVELDNLKHYLLNNRITSVSFKGEYERNRASKTLTLREEINIDRICDGLRSVFRDEFHHDLQQSKKGGLKNWKKRKMIIVKNNMLNYLATVARLDSLSLEDQNHIIGRLSDLAGFKE